MSNFHAGQPTQTDLDFELADAQRRWAGLDNDEGDPDDWTMPADAEPVPTGLNCPACGEARLDHLIIGEGTDDVECATCGAVYYVE